MFPVCDISVMFNSISKYYIIVIWKEIYIEIPRHAIEKQAILIC